MRYDLQIIASWIGPGSHVLDLGCGNGALLEFLIKNKQVTGSGIELEEGKVATCIEKGLSVLQGDINAEVPDYPDQTFDYVILSQTLQQVYEPDTLIRALMRIGLPFEWYNTPNIRVITIKDFRKFIDNVGLKILNEVAINTHSQDRYGKIIKFLPNIRATYGIFLIGNRQA
jgi:ubiquinone/menaquinone biosynthesis C-methylase UbiE